MIFVVTSELPTHTSAAWQQSADEMAAKCRGDLLSGLVEMLNVTYFWHHKWYEQRRCLSSWS